MVEGRRIKSRRGNVSFEKKNEEIEI